jgi:hypothetical protein
LEVTTLNPAIPSKKQGKTLSMPICPFLTDGNDRLNFTALTIVPLTPKVFISFPKNDRELSISLDGSDG